MISQTAKSDINAMIKDGLKPTFEDIVRLNVMGLAYEHAGEVGDCYAMPRVAILGRLNFREPVIGHYLWIDRVSKSVTKDAASLLAVRAYAISRSYKTLPNALDLDAVKAAIDEFCAGPLSPFTYEQINAAVSYAYYGADQCALEYPAADPEDEINPGGDVLRSVAVGCVIETMSLGLGLSVRDVHAMTKSQLDSIKRLALLRNGFDLRKCDRPKAEENYYMTRDEIRERLQKERDNG